VSKTLVFNSDAPAVADIDAEAFADRLLSESSIETSNELVLIFARILVLKRTISDLTVMYHERDKKDFIMLEVSADGCLDGYPRDMNVSDNALMQLLDLREEHYKRQTAGGGRK